MDLMARPYKLLARKPIVLFLSLLSGYSNALIFTGLASFPIVLKLWDFSKTAIGLFCIPLLLGYIIAYIMFLTVYRRDRKQLRENLKSFSPERRLWLLLFLVILGPIGLAGFGAGSLGPPTMHGWCLYSSLVSSG